jgi:hypothetical protein
MYRFPKDLNLSPVIGEFITQFRVGQWDIQFTLGKVDFAIQSQITLLENNEQIGQWIEGQWPDPEFIKLFNSEVTEWEIISDQLLVLKFVNGIEMHLTDNSDQYESMQISFSSDDKQSII